MGASLTTRQKLREFRETILMHRTRSLEAFSSVYHFFRPLQTAVIGLRWTSNVVCFCFVTATTACADKRNINKELR